MKRIIFFCVFTLLIATGLFSEGLRERSASDRQTAGSSVWKASKDGNILYLGGSVHILRAADFPLPVEFDYAFSASEILVLEANAELLSDPEIAEYLYSQLYLPGDTTLQSLLDFETYTQLSDVCEEYGISIANVDNLRPSMLVNILLLYQIQKLGFEEEGIDENYRMKAKKENKSVLFLESVETQIDMLLSLGEGYENEYVAYSLADMENTEESLEILMHEWKYGIEGSNEETITEIINNWPEMYKTLITDRHDKWLPQIEAFTASGKVHFVVTGLMHMYGPDGLIQRLKNLGYTVEKLRL